MKKAVNRRHDADPVPSEEAAIVLTAWPSHRRDRRREVHNERDILRSPVVTGERSKPNRRRWPAI